MTDRTTDHASFTIERRFDAPPALVYAAWADVDAKRAWFADGEGWEFEAYDLDFRVGGREYGRVRTKDGATYVNNTVYLDIVEGRRIVFAYTMSGAGDPFSASLATITLAPAGAGTKLVFVEQAVFFEGGDGPAMREGGWRELLDGLERWLAAADAGA